MPSTPSATMNAAAAAVVAAAASQASLTPQRKRKHEAAPADYLERPIKWGKSSRDVTCTQQQFESMLQKPYGPRVNNDGIRKSGKDKLGHTLYYDGGLVRCQACNNKRVVYGAIVQHIIGEGHCKKVAKIYKDKASIIYSKQKLPDKQDADGEGDEAVASDEAIGQVTIPALPDYESMLQDADAADGGKKSPTKRKTPKKNAGKTKATYNGDSQHAVTIQGGLVVNGLDILKYIRGLEGRISELESKLAAATSTEMTSTENTNLV